MAKLWVIVSALAFISLASAAAKRDHNDYTKNPHRLVCYFGSWANYHANEKFLIEDVNYELCTHINYGFAKLDEYNWTIVAFDPYLDIELMGYKRFTELRKKNPNLTTMIALGGWYEGSEKYSDMAATPGNRSRFVKSAVEFLQKHDFDGLDMDWEYPANRLGRPYDKQNFMTLMKELKEAFEPHGFLLTSAMSPGKPTIDTAYEKVPELNDILDWANVMTYDYHGAWEDILGHNAPLYRRPDELDDIHKWFTVNFTIHYYLDLGLKKEKMVMGVPFYGRAWTMEAGKNHLNDSAKGMSPKGFINGEYGVLGYNEICQLEMNLTDTKSAWTNKYDPYYRAPYAYNDEIWVGFDNQESLSCKIAFLKEMGLSGGMVWALENDDFKNRCKGGSYPLLHRVHSMLNGDKINSYECNLADIQTTPTTVPTTPTTTPTTTEPTTPTTKPTTPTTEPTTPTTEPTTPTTLPTTPTTLPTTPTTLPTTPTTEPTTPTTKPTTPTTLAPTTHEPTKPVTTEQPKVTKLITDDNGNHKVIKCYSQGKYPHPTDRHKFVVCEYIAEGSNKGWWIHIMGCAPGTRWHQPTQNCIADDDGGFE